MRIEDASSDPVVVAPGIRQVATFELGSPSRYYDGMALLEIVADYAGAKHVNT